MEEKQPARAQHPRGLGDDRARLFHVFQEIHGANGVKTSVAERKAQSVALLEPGRSACLPGHAQAAEGLIDPQRFISGYRQAVG
jgi:hypothetical protein